MAGANNTFVIRALRLLRLLAFAKIGRYSAALQHIQHAIQVRQYELLVAFTISMVVLLLAATAMYLVEGSSQPDAFGSIPRSLWWSVSTLTTVGYGDVYPLTPLGKLLAGITSLAAIGLFALPTGILAAAFAEALREHGGANRPDKHGNREER